jgi:hypothetical protein
MPNLPLKKLRSEPATCRIAKATLGKRSTANWDDLTVNYAKIRDSIAVGFPVLKISTSGSEGCFICHTLSAIAENSQTSRARRRSPLDCGRGSLPT